jgi:hypothetical protein
MDSFPNSNDVTATNTQSSMSMGGPADHQAMAPSGHGHSLSPTDPDNPQNWPLHRKVYAVSTATAFAFVV